MSVAVAVFAKTIGLSPVKTRLAKGIGKDLAEEFYRKSVKAIEELMIDLKASSKEEITPYWALAEEEGVFDKRWDNFETIWTGSGDLGERQFNMCDVLLKKHDKVIIIGTDSPQFESKTILQAIDRLNENPKECVIGPAFDGGFYLFALSTLVSKEIWTSVTYSREDTLKQLLSKLDSENISYDFLKYMSDVDDISDLDNVFKSLNLIEEPTYSQKNLIKWLESLIVKSEAI